MSANLSIAGAGTSGASQIWSGASAPMSPTQKMTNLFDSIDTSGSGTISQSQFNQAFQTMGPPASFQSAGATAVWNQLDPNGTGSVSKQDFVKGMTAMMQQLRGHHHHHHGGGGGAQSLAQSTSLLDALGPTGGSSDGSASGSTTTGTSLNSLA